MFGQVAQRRRCWPTTVARNADKLVSLAADKGYDSATFKRQFRNFGIRTHIRHKLYQPNDHAPNARLDYDRYNQRALTETMNFATKHSILDSVSSRAGTAYSAKLSPPHRFTTSNEQFNHEPATLQGFNTALVNSNAPETVL